MEGSASTTWSIFSKVFDFSNSAVGFSIDQHKRDSINREIATKEIRILDINVVMTIAAQLKK